MRIESQKPYGLPNVPLDPKETANDRAERAPEKTTNTAGDEFQLSSKQIFTRSLVSEALLPSQNTELSPERTAEIKARVASGYYLTPGSAEETASALTSFHR